MTLRRSIVIAMLLASVSVFVACSRSQDPTGASASPPVTGETAPNVDRPASAFGPRGPLAAVLSREGEAEAGARPAVARPAAERPAAAEPGDVPAGTMEHAAASKAYFPDVELVDQDGKPHRFYSDLVKGRLVLVNFGFSRCKGACNPIMRNLAKVQRSLGARVGRDVLMLTISVDPVNDTPASMKELGARHGALAGGWLLLSGTPANVRTVLERLGGWTAVPDEHSTVVLIGDDRTGTWTKAVGFTPAEAIVDAVLHLED